jgi:hypothetical protein
MLLSQHTRRREIITHADPVAIQGRACRTTKPPGERHDDSPSSPFSAGEFTSGIAE